MKIVLTTLIVSLSVSLANAQQKFLQLLDPNQSWILDTPKILKGDIVFVNYSKEKVELNTMIWKFLPNGLIEYDYQSSEDVFACAGVDFLDMDLDESRWQYDPGSMILTLQIKGGYASIDDFVFKRAYRVSLYDSEKEYGYRLTPEKEYFFNDLRKRK